MATSNEFLQLESSLEASVSTDSYKKRIVVSDVDVHYAQAIGAGAEIVVDLHEDEHGRSYSCRVKDQIWNFRSYDPQNRRSWS